MDRRTFLAATGVAMMSRPASAGWNESGIDAAAAEMRSWVEDGRVEGASIVVCQRTLTGSNEVALDFGTARGDEPVFLLASISKPMTAAAVMTLVDEGELSLDDTVNKFFPEFTGEGREQITLRQCLSHTSGLPDMLSNNEQLRINHAPLDEYRKGTFQAPLKFAPGTDSAYSSMGILIAAEIAEKISGKPFGQFIDEKVYRPLGMTRTSMGLMGRPNDETVQNQAAPAGTEEGKQTWLSWNWNSQYWRDLGSPWGGALGSAADVARFYEEFLLKRGTILKPETEALMLSNQSPPGVAPRGLGFGIGSRVGAETTGPNTFGHNGSTGTLSWCDPDTGTICVVLTTLYAAAVRPHPTQLVSELVGKAVS